MTEDLFVREDLSKPENRINVSLFGLLAVTKFREWLLTRLNLPTTAVVYPSANVVGTAGSIRPDFVVKHGAAAEPVAWIEVECGRDEAQLARFRAQLPERVIAIWGQRGAPADLGLDEIASFLDAVDVSDEHPQVRHNLAHLRKLIAEALDGAASRYRPAPVAEAVRETPFVRALHEVFGPRLSWEVGAPMRAGDIRASTLGEHGFSLRVFSRLASGRSVSLLNQQAGRPEIRFPSKVKLIHYLPERGEAVEQLVALVAEMGADMTRLDENALAVVPLATAERFATRLAATVMDLAGSGGRPSE